MRKLVGARPASVSMHGNKGRKIVRLTIHVRRRAAGARRDVHIGVHLADLLAYSLVRAVEGRAAEADEAICLEILCRYSEHLDRHLVALANNDGVKELIGVHDVEVRAARDELAVQCENDVALLQTVTVAGVDLAHHEELVTLWIGVLSFLDPLFRDAHDARLAHLNGLELNVEDAEFGCLAAANFVEDGEKVWRCET